MPRNRTLACWITVATLASATWSPAVAAPPNPAVADARVADINRALDERRLVDAGRMLDQALLAGVQDARLDLLTGELQLARGRPADALETFNRVRATPSARATALQGAGLALSLLGKSNEALAALEEAVDADPRAGRAWNGLGAEYDRRREWSKAEVAYDHAFAAMDDDAPVFNNRGFSRLLQGRLDEAVADFVQALEHKPDMEAARTNLRLAMAMRGEYEQAVSGGAPGEMATLLNNAGFAAAVRGDYRQANDLLAQAIRSKGEYYRRASANLEYARDMAARDRRGPAANADR
jgi:Flp pilus assembly protein TadD